MYYLISSIPIYLCKKPVQIFSILNFKYFDNIYFIVKYSLT